MVNSEKSKLQQKIENLLSEGTRKEKEITSLECKNGSLEAIIKERDEIIEIYNQNQAEQEKRLEEQREQEIEIRDLNLQKEQMEEKIKDLEQNIFEINEENQERVNDLKTKVKNLKLQMIRENKREKENDNRHNITYTAPEDKIWDFLFITIVDIQSVSPISAAHEPNEILRRFMEYHIYEIDVADQNTGDHYVIERTSHEILGLFKRLKENYKRANRVSADYQFPDNLKECLFDKNFSEEKMKKLSLQHYINEAWKQECFRKSQELAAFLEVARFKTSKQFDEVLREVTNFELNSDSDMD